MNKDDGLNAIPDLLKSAFHVEYPWNLVAAYPKETWTVLKILHDENEKLKAEVDRLRSAARIVEVLKNCGENSPREV